jgi:hypothetical protein
LRCSLEDWVLPQRILSSGYSLFVAFRAHTFRNYFGIEWYQTLMRMMNASQKEKRDQQDQFMFGLSA